MNLLCMGVSQREIARFLQTKPRTVARILVRLAIHVRTVHETWVQTTEKISTAVFDEMETFEHSKCKPLSIAVAVDEKTYKVLGVKVASMPAKGKLAAIAKKRYGYRRDDRSAAITTMLASVSRCLAPRPTIKSDQCPRYPAHVKALLPGAIHLTFKGRRSCVVGQGELKRGGRDPLFALNHTCATIRDRIKRLARRTWCTTKRPDRLQDLLDLFVFVHNKYRDGEYPAYLC